MRLPQLIMVLLLIGTLAARADDLKEQAKRDVSAGIAAQSGGHYDEAIALYKKAYAAIPHPEILFNLGQAYRLKGDAETALDYYRRYLAAEPNGRAAGDANRWVTELDKRIADRKREQDRKAADARKAADGKPKADTGRKADAASRVDTGRKPDAVGTVDTRGRADAVGKADVVDKVGTRRGADQAESARDATLPAAAGPRDSVAVTSAPPQDDRPAHDNTAVWIAGVGGGVSLIAGLGVGSLARGKMDEATAICGSDHRCDSEADTARANALLAQSRTRGTISTALVVVGVGSLVLSGALWLQHRGSDGSGVAIAPIVSSHGVGIALGGSL